MKPIVSRATYVMIRNVDVFSYECLLAMTPGRCGQARRHVSQRRTQLAEAGSGGECGTWDTYIYVHLSN